MSEKVWADFKEMAIAYAEERVFHNEKMMRMMGIGLAYPSRYQNDGNLCTDDRDIRLPRKGKKTEQTCVSSGNAATYYWKYRK